MRSTEGQVTDASARAAERGAQIGEVHVDNGRSAWNPRVHRPGWARLMERLESGATGGVIVWDLARFSRQPIEGERLIAAAESGLLVFDSEGEYDLTSASGKKAFRDQMSAAAYESDRLSTRVRRGKRLKAMRGEPNSSPRPFGFEADAVTVRESEAAVLRDLAARLLAGETQDSMILDLTERGIRTSIGGAWSGASLRAVLTRARNAGLIEYCGTIVSRLPGVPIIDQATHDRVLALFTARRRGRPTSDAYLCSGLVVCGKCGKRLSGRPRANMLPYVDGGVRREYWCQPRVGEGGCGRVAVDQRDLDRCVRGLVATILGDPQHAATVEAEARAAATTRQQLEDELAECEQLVEFLDGRLTRREIPQVRYARTVEPLEAQIAELQRRLGELDVIPAADVDEADVVRSQHGWLSRWDDATVVERRRMIRRALRERRLLVMPADRPRGAAFDPERVVVE
jgi:DNA invertase Pin-like site-specific DNA recombinase